MDPLLTVVHIILENYLYARLRLFGLRGLNIDID